MGIGVIMGGLSLGVWGGFRRRIHTSLFGVIGMGISILLVGLAPDWAFAPVVGLVGVMGLMMSFANGPLMAIMQATIAPSMQGRVFTLLTSGSTLMMPLGLIAGGPLADAIGVQTWFVIGGVVTLAAGIAGLLIPSIVNIEQERDDHPLVGEMFTEAPPA